MVRPPAAASPPLLAPRWRCWLALAALLLATAGAANDGLTIDPLIGELDAIRERNGVAGAALVIVDAEQVLWSGGIGIMDWRSRRPMTADRYVRIGSITKAITGLALLKADSAGLLSLERPIAQLVDPLPLTNRWQDTAAVTVAQLLEHSAGLTDMLKVEWDHNRPLPLVEALKLAPESRRLQWPPGLHSSYSNSGAGVAAYVFEQATARDFERHVAQMILGPLNMTSATFDLSAAVKADLMTGYDRDGRSTIPYWHTLYRPFGGLNVRVRDMGRLLQMLLASGQPGARGFLSPTELARFENPATTLAARHGLDFGYGLGNYHYLRDGFVFHGHGGDADGYLSHFGYNRDSGLGYFIVINAFQGSTLRAMRKRIESTLVAGLRPQVVAARRQPRGSLRALTGRWLSVTHRFPGRSEVRELHTEFAAGRLYLRRGNGNREHLIPVASGLFRRAHEPVATLAIVEHDGNLYLQGPMGNYARSKRPAAP